MAVSYQSDREWVRSTIIAAVSLAVSFTIGIGVGRWTTPGQRYAVSDAEACAPSNPIDDCFVVHGPRPRVAGLVAGSCVHDQDGTWCTYYDPDRPAVTP